MSQQPIPTVTVSVNKQFTVPPERVFDAWLDPSLLRRWMFNGSAAPTEEVIHVRTDPRAGGRFSFLVRRDGEEVDHVGTYSVLDRPTKLVFSWGIVGQSENDHSVVTITIQRNDQGCLLTLTHVMDARWKEYAERTEQGWNTILGMLAGQLH